MDVADLTLDELRLALAPGIAQAAVFDGWSANALDMAADQLGADRDVARLAFKDDGAMGMICAWIESIDLADDPWTLPAAKSWLRCRSASASAAFVQFRLDAVTRAGGGAAPGAGHHGDAAERRAGALKAGWHSADVMWRLAGDTATDYNHYTKRAILASIYGCHAGSVFVGRRERGQGGDAAPFSTGGSRGSCGSSGPRRSG